MEEKLLPEIEILHHSFVKLPSNGVFTPEQDDKTPTRQMLNMCIPMMPFTFWGGVEGLWGGGSSLGVGGSG